LGHVAEGRYVDVGACDPTDLSVTKAFYDRGWRGIDIDPVPEYADRLRKARSGNEVVEAAITSTQEREVVLHQLVDTGLSTLVESTAARHESDGFVRREITVRALSLDEVLESSTLVTGDFHFLKVDVEGAEADVLASIDLHRWRPWVVVVEATEPLSTTVSYEAWEPMLLEAGYDFCLFDGLSRFYVAKEHTEVAAKLSYPACVFDDFQTARVAALEAEAADHSRVLAEANQQAIHWRNQAVAFWAESVARVQKSDTRATQAVQRADGLHLQLDRARKKVQQVRSERNRLQAEVKRLRALVEELQDRPLTRTSQRLRAVVKKATGA
jgi:FkbM family methyltransferase